MHTCRIWFHSLSCRKCSYLSIFVIKIPRLRGSDLEAVTSVITQPQPRWLACLREDGAAGWLLGWGSSSTFGRGLGCLEHPYTFRGRIGLAEKCEALERSTSRLVHLSGHATLYLLHKPSVPRLQYLLLSTPCFESSVTDHFSDLVA